MEPRGCVIVPGAPAPQLPAVCPSYVGRSAPGVYYYGVRLSSKQWPPRCRKKKNPDALDVVVGLDHLVSDLHHQLEGNVGLLDGRENFRRVDVLTRHEFFNGLVGVLLHRIDFADGIEQKALE